MDGLFELLGIICLFGLAPVLTWRLWRALEPEQPVPLDDHGYEDLADSA
jgi:hypothetical protein